MHVIRNDKGQQISGIKQLLKPKYGTAAPKGTKYESLALPYIKNTVEYKVIVNRVKVICIVEKGKVAPGFDSDGGAVQYMHPISIKESIKNGLIERIDF